MWDTSADLPSLSAMVVWSLSPVSPPTADHWMNGSFHIIPGKLPKISIGEIEWLPSSCVAQITVETGLKPAAGEASE